jgi:hypothetical protein
MFAKSSVDAICSAANEISKYLKCDALKSITKCPSPQWSPNVMMSHVISDFMSLETKWTSLTVPMCGHLIEDNVMTMTITRCCFDGDCGGA